MRVLWTVLLLVLLTPGCAEFQDHRYRMVNHLRAGHAWRECGATSVANGAASPHYKRGWINGYYEVLTGGSDVPPVVPPKKYWAPKFQTPEGQQAISDWYQGFQMGAMAATSAPIRSELPVCVPDSQPPMMAECAPVNIPEEHFIPEHHITPQPPYSPEPYVEPSGDLPPLPDLPRYIVPQPQQRAPAPPSEDREFLPPVSASPHGNGPQLVPPQSRHRQAARDPRRRSPDQYVRPVAAVRHQSESYSPVVRAESTNPQRAVCPAQSRANGNGAIPLRHPSAPAPCRRIGTITPSYHPTPQPVRRSVTPPPAPRSRRVVPTSRAYRVGTTSAPFAAVESMVGIVRISGGRTLTVVAGHLQETDPICGEGMGVAIASTATTVVTRAQSADLSPESERLLSLADQDSRPTVRKRPFDDAWNEDSHHVQP